MAEQHTIGAGSLPVTFYYTSFGNGFGNRKARKKTFFFAFIPINLIARDLLCEFGIIVKCKEEGLQIKRVENVSF